MIRLDNLNYRTFSVGLLVLAISLAPRIPLPFNIPGRVFDLRLEDIIISLIVIALVLNFVVRGRSNTKFFSVPLIKPIGVYCLIVILTTNITLMFHSNLLDTMAFLRILLYTLKQIELFLIFFIVANFIKTESEIKLIGHTILIAGILNILWVLCQLITGRYGPIVKIDVSGAAFQHAGRFATYGTTLMGEFSPFSIVTFFGMITYWFFGYSYIVYRKKIIKSSICLWTGIICFICSALTAEKISIIYFIIGVLMIVFLDFKKSTRFIIFILLFILFVLSISDYLINLVSALERMHMVGYMGGIAERKQVVDELLATLGTFKNYNFLLGFGKGGNIWIGNQEVLFGEAHNGYFRLIIESGIFGFITFIGLLMQIGLLCIKTFKNSLLNITKVVSFSTFCALLAISIAANVQDAFTSVLPNELFWAFVGLTVAAYKIEIIESNKLRNSIEA